MYDFYSLPEGPNQYKSCLHMWLLFAPSGVSQEPNICWWKTPILNRVWYLEPTHSDAAVAPSSIKSAVMGEFYSILSDLFSIPWCVTNYPLQKSGIRTPGRFQSEVDRDWWSRSAHLDLDYDGKDEEIDPTKAIRFTWPHGTMHR
jgi:hypothetical protein